MELFDLTVSVLLGLTLIQHSSVHYAKKTLRTILSACTCNSFFKQVPAHLVYKSWYMSHCNQAFLFILCPGAHERVTLMPDATRADLTGCAWVRLGLIFY